MDFDLAFSLVNLSVMPAWLMLVFFPRWSVTQTLVHSMLYPLILGAVYSALLLLSVFGGMGGEGGGFSSIAAVRTLFSVDIGIVVGWTLSLIHI